MHELTHNHIKLSFNKNPQSPTTEQYGEVNILHFIDVSLKSESSKLLQLILRWNSVRLSYWYFLI